MRRVVANLTFDSRRAGSTFGMRSLRTASRQMLYSAPDTALDLRVTVQNDECVVAGQVIREGCARGFIELSGGTGAIKTSLNELCEFTLSSIPLGNYSLKIRLRDVEILIPEIDLKD